ncbi:MAG: hypothetical protein HYZ88_02630 [Candidatus Omnitrophica bacterium]|nr:hypothetical protein [Candidatus Omnitrophota bacterium]
MLVEATLTAVIIAVGLVLISRGIGGSLNALARLQAYDHLLQLAESKLSDLEIEAQQFHALAQRSGTFDAPDAAVPAGMQGDQWTLEIRRVQIADLPPDAVNRVTLTVRSSNAKSPTVTLATFWPSDWLVE